MSNTPHAIMQGRVLWRGRETIVCKSQNPRRPSPASTEITYVRVALSSALTCTAVLMGTGHACSCAPPTTPYSKLHDDVSIFATIYNKTRWIIHGTLSEVGAS